jgi:hypothetical protein
MKRLLLGAVVLALVTVLLAVGHLAFIEIGREVVTLRTPRPGGGWQETRLWIVDDDDGSAWLHSGGRSWWERVGGDPIVEVERRGEVRRYRAHAVPGPHPQIDRLLREKYGLADRWVRFLSPDNEGTLVVRLDPL